MKLLLTGFIASMVFSVQANELCDSYLPSPTFTALDPIEAARRSSSSSQSESLPSTQISINDSDVAVLITGHVDKNSSNNLINASNVELRFWKTNEPNAYVTTQTDEQGNYEIELSNGEWQGEACGAEFGYSPAAWQVSLLNNKLINMQAVSVSTPRITTSTSNLQQSVYPSNGVNAMAYSIGKNEELVVKGRGFGCNGSLVFEFINSVDSYGDTNDVEYNHQPIVKNNYCSRSDLKISLPMPSLSDTQIRDDGVSLRYARLYYQKGNQRSNAIYVSEFVSPLLNPAYKNSGEIVNNDDSITKTNVKDIGKVGSENSGGSFPGGSGPGGFFGGPLVNNTSTSGRSFFKGTAGSATSQGITGVNARVLNTGNINTGNLTIKKIPVDSVNLDKIEFN